MRINQCKVNPKLPSVVTIALAAGLLVLAAGLHDARGQAAADNNAVRVGVYNQERLFQEYPGTQELIDFYQQARQQLQAAQQNGDEQKAQQIQQQMETRRQEVINEFHATMEQAVSDVAQDAGIKVVATEVIYTADDVNTTDMTGQLAEAISDNGQGQGNQRTQPF